MCMRNEEAIQNVYFCTMMTQTLIPNVTQLIRCSKSRGDWGNTSTAQELLSTPCNCEPPGFFRHVVQDPVRISITNCFEPLPG